MQKYSFEKVCENAQVRDNDGLVYAVVAELQSRMFM